jgi:hypothetical protein
MKYRFKFLILGLAPLALALGPTPTKADLSTLTVSNGASGSSALAATATFDTSQGQMVVTLTNNLSASSIVSSGQGISDIQFTLGNTSGTVNYSATGSSVSGQIGNIDSSNTVTYVSGDPLRWLGQGPPPPNGMGTVPSVTGNTVTVQALGGGMPSQLISPSIANGGTYTSANMGFNNPTPFVIGTNTITLSLSGVTANTTVTTATISFGTTAFGTTLTGTPTHVVPEPATSFLVLAALVPLGVVRLIRHRRRRTTAPA